MELFDLTGKTVLITGGAGHLGKAMSDLNQKYGGLCRGVAVDISSEEDILLCVNRVIEAEGKIDVLVNNAAYSVAGYFEDLTEELWKRAIDGTVNSVFRMCSAVIPKMVQQGKGSIINIASMYGMVSPDPKIYRDNVEFAATAFHLVHFRLRWYKRRIGLLITLLKKPC